MNESSPFNESGQVRRLIVAVVVSTVAVITAGAVLTEHPVAGTGVEHAAAGTAVPDALTPAAGRNRRVQWRDPWQHPASDPSVPAAAKALERAADPASGEQAPTF